MDSDRAKNKFSVLFGKKSSGFLIFADSSKVFFPKFYLDQLFSPDYVISCDEKICITMLMMLFMKESIWYGLRSRSRNNWWWWIWKWNWVEVLISGVDSDYSYEEFMMMWWVLDLVMLFGFRRLQMSRF